MNGSMFQLQPQSLLTANVYEDDKKHQEGKGFPMLQWHKGRSR